MNRRYEQLPYLRAWRLHRRWSQRELSTRAGISAPSISILESGKPARPLSTVLLAAALGITPRQLREVDPFEQEVTPIAS